MQYLVIQNKHHAKKRTVILQMTAKRSYIFTSYPKVAPIPIFLDTQILIFSKYVEENSRHIADFVERSLKYNSVIFLHNINNGVVKPIAKSSSAAGHTRRRLGNTSTCPHVCFDMCVLTVQMCVSTYNKVLISCRTY